MKFLPLFQSLHKWLGLLVGVQLFIWMLSGMVFSLLPQQLISGQALVNEPLDPPLMMPEVNFDQVVNRHPTALSVKIIYLDEEMLYLVEKPDGRLVLSTATLAAISIGPEVITLLAKTRYLGDGELLRVSKEYEKTVMNRRFRLPVWHAEFSGEQNASLFFDGQSGQYLGIKVDNWRLFDLMWMLHIMDYSERENFNHPLIILVASLSLFLTLSGFLLIFNGFSWMDFRWFGRFNKLPIRITGKDGFDSEIFVPRHARLYDSLASVGFDLPSNCGGGGSCGECKVKLIQADSPIVGGIGLLSESELADGYHLACQTWVDSGLVVELPEMVLHQQVLQCEVVSNDFVTPVIKELTVKLPRDSGFVFAAGEYVQLHCPAGKTALSEVEVPEAYSQIWQDLDIEQLRSTRSQAILRPYSMANNPVLTSQLQFNIRLALPKTPGAPVGASSSYLFSLKPGNKIDLSGPFGYFHAIESEREMIFIGGGAGMAPLRSHILYQLQSLRSRRKIRFFFGARTAQDIFYQQEFDRLARKFSNFEWTVSISEPKQSDNWQGPVGNIPEVMHEAYLAAHPNVRNCEFYLCGPALMNEAVSNILSHYKVPRERIKYDDFGS